MRGPLVRGPLVGGSKSPVEGPLVEGPPVGAAAAKVPSKNTSSKDENSIVRSLESVGGMETSSQHVEGC